MQLQYKTTKWIREAVTKQDRLISARDMLLDHNGKQTEVLARREANKCLSVEMSSD